MNEAHGNVANDVAFGRNAVLNASWQVSRDGKALALNGDNYMIIPIESMAFTSQSDFTIEFWFKAQMPQSEICLFSNGSFEHDGNHSAWKISANQSGTMTISNNGYDISFPATNYLNNVWQHFAMSMNRSGYLSVYINGELVKTSPINNLKGFGAYQMVLGALWYNQSTEDHYENFVTGAIDEIRVWNASRTQSQIKRYMNHTLKAMSLD
jgi:hypothetical protein